jgi:cytoskeletal protein CcmA (bactofilin family)
VAAPSIAATTAGRADAFLGQGSRVTGTLSFTGPVEIDGHVEGEINSKETLTIGKSAIVNARISGAEILVHGTVTGDIIASRRLVLKKPARVTGNIAAPSLSVEEGVLFEGKCAMTTAATASDSKAFRPQEKSAASA